jgi:PII-like signaling protein
VNDDCLKLTTYFGERDRANGGFLADAFSEIYGRHQLQTSLVMRGVEGFGPNQHIRTDRLLSLSEDLPLVSVAVDTRARIEAALAELSELSFNGLVTLERARMLTGVLRTAPQIPSEQGAETKLTVYVGRQERIGGTPAYEAVVEFLHARAIAGASVLLGVDGTAHGVRERARFFGRNAAVPLMIIAVGESARIAALIPELSRMLTRPLITLERIQVCKRDGATLAEPLPIPETDSSGLGVWQKLMVYAGEQAYAARQPLHQAVIRELRDEHAAGATSLRGIWGYHGDHQPHGDSFWQLRRRVPIVTVIIDTPARIRRWFEIIDRLTARTGLVTSEIVPASRSTARAESRGGLRLAERLLPGSSPSDQPPTPHD